ncbi:hypothetical protein L596_023962 [Steinernema carpocapsae]|uniref:Protein kinase domain-containing protein n=1 Tax=Steinernema carpocapsae TaxID=34508 RepID=A0A4U5MFH0_STECR|nr:hypothetical protein L596_023962 [Steinernema carpocapsae]
MPRKVANETKCANEDAKKKIQAAPAKGATGKGKTETSASKPVTAKSAVPKPTADKDKKPSKSRKKSKKTDDVTNAKEKATGKEAANFKEQTAGKEITEETKESPQRTKEEKTLKEDKMKKSALQNLKTKENTFTVDEPIGVTDDGDRDEAPITTVHLNVGDLITIVDQEYMVEEILLKGLIGQLYRVTNMKGKDKKEQLALKSEDAGYKGRRLKNEITFLKSLREVVKPIQLPTLYSTGRNETCRFMVTDLYGENLRDLNFKNRFSTSTCIRVAYHIFEAISELHTLGHYTHRNLAPSNFCASSREPSCPTVCLVNFSVAKKFCIDDSKSKRKTPRFKFYGNVRYAARNTHLLKERTRKDELESWLFIILDFFDEALLPWNRFFDRTEIYYGKTKLFENLAENLKPLESAIHWIALANTIDKMEDQEAPDYRYFKKRLEDIASRSKVGLSGPINWDEKRAKQ